MEEKMAQLKEKMRKLETECIQSIGEAREDGKEEVMEEVKAQFQMVYNSGFKDGWKSALNKTEVLDASDLFLRDNTPLPYPDARLKDTDDEVGEEDEDNKTTARWAQVPNTLAEGLLHQRQTRILDPSSFVKRKHSLLTPVFFEK